jgi:hypothetical protein
LRRSSISAQKLARQKYDTAYHMQACALERESKFETGENAKVAALAQG